VRLTRQMAIGCQETLPRPAHRSVRIGSEGLIRGFFGIGRARAFKSATHSSVMQRIAGKAWP
jgi:hypothetical protein